MKRMSEDNGEHYHPAAAETARALEHAGYVQASHKDLEDGEDVVAVDGRNGNVAPVRHHKFGEVTEHGIVNHHELEAYPDSPHATRMPLKHAYAESAQGDPYPSMGFFRLTSPEHAGHGANLYAARDSQHREAG